MKRYDLHNTRWIVIVALVLATSLQGCSVLRPGYETPTVTVNSFRALPSQGAMPNFEIGLHVVNPNSIALKLRGITYKVSLDGHELINGVANDLPTIEAYGQGDVVVTAAANLFGGIRFITDLLGGPKDSVRYTVEAKLDVGSFMPAIRVKDEGQIAL